MSNYITLDEGYICFRKVDDFFFVITYCSNYSIRYDCTKDNSDMSESFY